ncbi:MULTISPECIES: LamG domain-containing protein [Colwellia]|uniref:MSHA biogenesis protein MshQ n=1 Tax=Colwellia marinimaniae TaxID=1513592 RepID=A0ABQ0MPY3_9GAMM|nr:MULTISPECIES: LamG domain-containing protein [Colwellia]GAW94426.1 MSHA biogenesis protein MshQ [Colwellia marinimaniae]
MDNYIKILCFSLLLLSTQVFAICSQYMGLATLNEAGSVGFIEIKLLDSSISEGTYTTWKVKICKEKGNKNECTSELPLSVSTTLPYIVVATSFIPTNKGFDVLLTDALGETIDYLSVGYMAQQSLNDTICLTYDWDATESNSHDYRRMPDGTGYWGNSGNGNSGGNTGGAPNEDTPLSCDVVFPGGQPFSGSGSIVTGSNRPLCYVNGNWVNCAFEDFTSVGSINLDSNLGSFPDLSDSWTFTDAEYNFYNAAPDNENYRLITSGGTSAIYISGNAVFKKGVGLNVPFLGTGNPSELLIVVDGNLKIEENAVVNGFIYVNGDVVLEKGITFNGAVSASGSFDVKEGGRYTFDSSMLDDFDPHGFCEPVVPTGTLLALHRFEQTNISTQIDDTSGLDNHAENIFGGLSTVNGKYCRGFESESWNDYNGITDSFRSSLDVNDHIGLKGTISFWFNSRIDWDQGQERVLFDASSGSNVTDKYFVFEIQQDGRLKFAFEDSADSDFSLVEPSITNRAADTWYYLTVTWDYLANDFAIYVDGTLQIQQSRNTNGAMGELKQIVFGDNASNYTQTGNSNIASPYSSRGNYDEVRIYNKVLTLSEIQTDMNDDNGCAAELVAYYQMDELAWNGTDEVVSELGTLHGTAVGGLSTDRVNPARVGNPGTCGYGYFDGVNDFVQIAHDDSLSFTNEFTISTWIYPTKLPSSGLMTILSKDTNYEFHVTPDGEIYWWWNDATGAARSFNSSGANITANNWYHIAITYKDGEQVIYVNGVNKGQDNQATNLFSNTDPLQIGQDQYFSGRYFQGRIDEVKLYSGALSATEIDAIYQEVHLCDSYIDHFEVSTQNGQGLTCEQDIITIKACADAACSPYLDEANVVLSVTDSSNNVVLNKNVTFVGGEIDVSYIHTKQEDVTLSLDQAYECTYGAPATCEVVFTDAGFRFVSVASGSTLLPLQLSGKPSTIGYNADVLKVEAVKTDNSGACAPLLITGSVIDMAASYQTPNTGTKVVNISGTDIGTAPASTAFNSLPFTDVALDFGGVSQHSAEFVFTYADAGAMQLHARFELPDDDGNPSGEFITGSSNSIYVRPFAFDIFVDKNLPTNDIDYKINPAATDGNGSSADVFTVAGGEIRISTRAIAWQAGDDANNNGLADQGEDLTTNPTTANFTDVTLTSLTHGLVAPSTGVLGELTVTGADFSLGINVDTGTYDEVGIISLAALKENYLAADINIDGFVPYVGRFTPAYFTQNVNDHGTLNANHYDTCQMNSWVYAGQTRDRSGSTVGAISYDDFSSPIINITAFNLDGDITQNYTKPGFMKLTASGITIPAPIADDAMSRLYPDGNDEKVHLSANMSAGDAPMASGTNGVVSYTFNEQDHFIYEHNKHSKLQAFPANIPFLVTGVEDTDEVRLYSGSDTNIIATEKVITSGVEIRFGRWLLANSYGPETSILPVTMRTQHFNGTTFIDNEQENCLVPEIGDIENTGNIGDGGMELWHYRLADIGGPDNLLPSHTTPSVEARSFVSGLYQSLLFSAPGDGRQGSLSFEYQVPTWLQYDWNNDDNFTNNPTTTLTFGIFRGNDRIIYQREIDKIN